MKIKTSLLLTLLVLFSPYTAAYASQFADTEGRTEFFVILTDVSADDSFYAAVMRLIAAGILGPFNGNAEPGAALTREGTAYYLGKAFKLESGYIRGNEVDVGYEFRPDESVALAEIVVMLENIAPVVINAEGGFNSDVDGNVVINTAGVVLSDMAVSGNVFITEGAGSGDITLTNVSVGGSVISMGGGSNSVFIFRSNLGGVTAYGWNVYSDFDLTEYTEGDSSGVVLNIDFIAGNFFSGHETVLVLEGGAIPIYGWAVDYEGMKTFDRIIVSINGKSFATRVVEREDVSENFSSPGLVNSGFYVCPLKDSFNDGENMLAFILVDDEEKIFYVREHSFNVFDIGRYEIGYFHNALIHIDFIGETYVGGNPDGMSFALWDGPVEIHGWAINEYEMSVFDAVIVIINGKPYECAIIERTDTAEHFDAPGLANAGFFVRVPADVFDAGENEMEIILICDGGNEVFTEFFIFYVDK